MSTGNADLDRMLEGGLLPRRPYLVVGASGTGKSTLALQFLCDGVRRGERALFVTLEEPPNEIVWNHRALLPELAEIDVFDAIPDVMRYERTPFKDIASVRAAVPFGSIDPTIRRTPELTSVEVTISALEQMLRTEVLRKGYRRVVVDSLTALQYFCMKGYDPALGAQSFLRFLSDLRVTTLLTVESPLEDFETPEQMLARGEIRLFRWEADGVTVRAIGVEKFRGSSHDVRLHPYRIGPHGIDINLGATISRDTQAVVAELAVGPTDTGEPPLHEPSPVELLEIELRDLQTIGRGLGPIRAAVEAALAAARAGELGEAAHHLARALAEASVPPDESAMLHHTLPPPGEAALARILARAEATRVGIAPARLPEPPILAAQLMRLLEEALPAAPGPETLPPEGPTSLPTAPSEATPSPAPETFGEPAAAVLASAAPVEDGRDPHGARRVDGNLPPGSLPPETPAEPPTVATEELPGAIASPLRPLPFAAAPSGPAAAVPGIGDAAGPGPSGGPTPANGGPSTGAAFSPVSHPTPPFGTPAPPSTPAPADVASPRIPTTGPTASGPEEPPSPTSSGAERPAPPPMPTGTSPAYEPPTPAPPAPEESASSDEARPGLRPAAPVEGTAAAVAGLPLPATSASPPGRSVESAASAGPARFPPHPAPSAAAPDLLPLPLPARPSLPVVPRWDEAGGVAAAPGSDGPRTSSPSVAPEAEPSAPRKRKRAAGPPRRRGPAVAGTGEATSVEPDGSSGPAPAKARRKYVRKKKAPPVLAATPGPAPEGGTAAPPPDGPEPAPAGPIPAPADPADVPSRDPPEAT